MKQKNLYEIMVDEGLLFEDFNSFRSKSLEIINNDKDSYMIKREMSKYFGSLNNFLKKLFDIVDKSDYVKNMRALMLFINSGPYNYNPRFILGILEVYVNLSKKNTKQYGIKLIKLNDNPKARDILLSPSNLRNYLLDVLNKIKEIKDIRSGKAETIDNRKADIILLDDRNVTISLFTKYSTSNYKFEGMTDWCTTKKSFRWNQYTKDGILVLFRDKSIKFIDKKETPNAYCCNHYNIINSNELDIPTTYDMLDADIPHPNFTTEYHDFVEKECKKIFDNDLMNHNDFIEVVNYDDEDNDDSAGVNLFRSVLNDFLVDDRVLGDGFAHLGSNYEFTDYDSELLEEIKEEAELMEGAEFDEGLGILRVNIDDDIDFPTIGFIGGRLFIINSSGIIEIEDNNIKSLIIKSNEPSLSVVFYSKLKLKRAEISISEDTYFYSSEGVNIENLDITLYGGHRNVNFYNIETTKSASVGTLGYSDLLFKTEDRGSELKFEVYMDFPNTSIEGFEKVYITISDDLDIEEYIKFDKDVKEVHFNITGDYGVEDLKNMIADETLEFENEDVKIFYSDDE